MPPQTGSHGQSSAQRELQAMLSPDLYALITSNFVSHPDDFEHVLEDLKDGKKGQIMQMDAVKSRYMQFKAQNPKAILKTFLKRYKDRPSHGYMRPRTPRERVRKPVALAPRSAGTKYKHQAAKPMPTLSPIVIAMLQSNKKAREYGLTETARNLWYSGRAGIAYKNIADVRNHFAKYSRANPSRSFKQFAALSATLDRRIRNYLKTTSSETGEKLHEEEQRIKENQFQKELRDHIRLTREKYYSIFHMH